MRPSWQVSCSVIIAGIGRTVGYFTYNHDSLDFSCQSHALVAVQKAASNWSSLVFLDVFYDFLVWTSIEPCLGVVGCCLPTLGPLVDVKYSAIYFKIKDTFSRQSLLQKSASEANRKRPEQRNSWVELTDERRSQSESRVGYGTPVDAESLDGTSPTPHEHGSTSVKQHN